jgi:hypothetical protein
LEPGRPFWPSPVKLRRSAAAHRALRRHHSYAPACGPPWPSNHQRAVQIRSGCNLLARSTVHPWTMSTAPVHDRATRLIRDGRRRSSPAGVNPDRVPVNLGVRRTFCKKAPVLCRITTISSHQYKPFRSSPFVYILTPELLVFPRLSVSSSTAQICLTSG